MFVCKDLCEHALVTESGIVTDFRFLQPAKAQYLIDVTELGIFIDSKLSHPTKVSMLIEDIELGRFTLSRFKQLSNALLPI